MQMPEPATGILKFSARREGELRDPARSLRTGPEDVRVPAKLIREYGLPEGAMLSGPVRRGRAGPLRDLPGAMG